MALDAKTYAEIWKLVKEMMDAGKSPDEIARELVKRFAGTVGDLFTRIFMALPPPGPGK